MMDDISSSCSSPNRTTNQQLALPEAILPDSATVLCNQDLFVDRPRMKTKPSSLESETSIEESRNLWVDPLIGTEVTWTHAVDGHSAVRRPLKVSQVPPVGLTLQIAVVKDSRTGRYFELDQAISLELTDPERNIYRIPGLPGNREFTLPLELDFSQQGKIVLHGETLRFDDSIEIDQHCFKSARLMELASNEEWNLKQDIDSGYPNSVAAVGRNNLRKQLISKLSVALEQAQIDDVFRTLLKRSNKLDDVDQNEDDEGLFSDSQPDQDVQESLERLASWLETAETQLFNELPTTIGGLPETASEQLQRFMEIYDKVEQNRSLVERLERHVPGSLKQRLENVAIAATEKKNRFELALKDATEFHDTLQSFIDWLIAAEKSLGQLKPISHVIILSQIEEHTLLQKDIAFQGQVMSNLDKKGTRLKYFSQKQDVILIKNLIISMRHRWKHVLSRATERKLALDRALKEVKEHYGSIKKQERLSEKGYVFNRA